MNSVDPVDGHAAVALTNDAVVDFSLECLATTGNVRSMGSGKHQARVHMLGKENAQEPYADMTSALLNIASGKSATWAVVSEDGFTASQAIPDVADRINDGDPTNDELAKDVDESMNLGQSIPAGWTRDQWTDIAYKAPSPRAQAFSLEQNTPNPFNPKTTIRFDLPNPARYTLTIYNPAGRVVEEILGQPASSKTLVVVRRALGHAQHVGDLLDRRSGEDAKFDNKHDPPAQIAQAVQCPIEMDEFVQIHL